MVEGRKRREEVGGCWGKKWSETVAEKNINDVCVLREELKEEKRREGGQRRRGGSSRGKRNEEVGGKEMNGRNERRGKGEEA